MQIAQEVKSDTNNEGTDRVRGRGGRGGGAREKYRRQGMHVAPAGTFLYVFNVYDSKLTNGKGEAHVALYWMWKSCVLL